MYHSSVETDENYDSKSFTYTIPSGVTLIVPYDDNDLTVQEATADAQYANYKAHTSSVAVSGMPLEDVYRSLTIPSGTTVILQGTSSSPAKLLVGGILAASEGGRTREGGTYGQHGNLVVDGELKLDDYSVLSTCGYVIGEGKIETIGTGATIYQPMVINDWGGSAYACLAVDQGTTGSTTYNKDNPFPSGETGVSPFTQWGFINIRTDVKLTYGNKLAAYCSLLEDGTLYTTTSVAVGDGGLLQLADGAYLASEWIDLWELGKTGTTVDKYQLANVNGALSTSALSPLNGQNKITVYGGATMGVLELSIKIGVLGGNFSSDDATFPINYSFDITLAGEGSAYTIEPDLVLLPGAGLTVAEGATLNLSGSRFVILDGLTSRRNGSDAGGGVGGVFSAEYKAVAMSFVANAATNAKYYPNAFALRDAGLTSTGKFVVNGTLNIGENTAFGGIIQSTKAGSKVQVGGTDRSEVSGSTMIGLTDSGHVGAYGRIRVGGSCHTLKAQVLSANGELVTLRRGITYVSSVGSGYLTKYVADYYYGMTDARELDSTYTFMNQEAPLTSDKYPDGQPISGAWVCATHVWDDGEEVAPTCTAEGYTKLTCTVCGTTSVSEPKVPATGHSYTGVVTAPTCTAAGYTTQTCSACGDSFTENEVAALGHKDENKDHTCDNKCGEYQGTHADSTTDKDHVCDYGCGAVLENCSDKTGDKNHACDVCGKENVTNHTYSDATCIAPAICSECGTTSGAALGHDEVSHTAKAPTCTEIGWDAYVTCSRCDYTTYVEKEALGHDEVSHNAQAPTCTEIGWDAYVTCSRCDYSTYAEKAELGHKWEDADCDTPKTCSVCDATEGEALGHTWVDADCDTPKTCSVCNETDGAPKGHTWVSADCDTPKTCSVCGATEGNPLGHDWTAANCTTAKTCKTCQATEGEALGHTWTDATCTAPKTCSVCKVTEGEALGHTWTDANCTTPKTCSVCKVTEGKALGHTHADAVIENNVDATCTTAGSYDTVVYCTVCGGEVSRNATTVNASGHTPGAAVIENDVKATCTAEGSYDSVVYCTVCNAEISRNTTVVDKVDHKGGEAVIENDVKATCTEGGSYDTVTYCTVCDAELSRVGTTIEALGHKAKAPVVENATNATCGAEGSYDSVVYCSTCNEKLSSEHVTVDALPHTYDSEITDSPTCTDTGIETFTCSACGDTYTEEVAALGHELISVEEKAPTCVDDGYEAYEYCTACDYTTYEKKAATGHSHEAVVTAPTCTADGYTTYTCSVCGDTYTDNVVEATGHTEAEAVRENDVAATCVANGSYENVVYCSVCDAEISRTKITVDALGHDWGEADCTTPKTCSVCNTTEGEPLGHKWVAADCDTPKTCSVCSVTEGEALGHTWTDATCTTPKTCSVCKATEGESLGHTWTDATCTTPKTCSVCKATEGAPLGHKWVAADCDTPKTCSVCGATEGSAVGHRWTDATCTSPKTCRTCGETEGTALGHTEAILTGKDATCTETGLTEGKHCSVCNKVLVAQEEVAALGHTEVIDAAKAPTCTQTGLTEGKHCSVCNKVLVAQETVNALGHDYDYANATYEWDVKAVKDATCTATAQCTRCDTVVTASGSVSAVTTYKPATCTEPGDVQFNADFDENAGWIDQTEHVVKGILPVLGHDWNDPVYDFAEDGSSCTATRSCKRTGCMEKETATATITSEQTKAPTCTETGTMTHTATFTEKWADVQTQEVPIEELGHDYKSVVTAPTCLSGGYTTHTCTRCKDSYISDQTGALGHRFFGENGEVIIKKVIDPTCEDQGYTIYECLNAGCTEIENGDYKDALGHNYVTVDAVAPTCTETGLTAGSKCNRDGCGHWQTEQTVVNALGHTHGTAKVENNVVPDCETPGSYDTVVYCTVLGCGAEVSRETVTVDALGHKAGAVVVENNVAPTCTEDGSYENVTYCTACGAETSRETVTVEKLGHTEETVPGKAATCTATGLTDGKKCTVCGVTTVAQEDIEKNSTNHTGTTAWKPIENDAEYHILTYSCCGATEGEKKAHVPGEKGCTECGQGCDHVYEDTVISPECDKNGYTKHTCTECGYTYTDTETPAAHTNVVTDSAKAPTCTETGLTEGSHCAACGETIVAQTVVDALGHTEVIDKAVAPTCTATGLTEGKHCSVCNEVFVAQTVVDSKGHTEVIDKAVAATCTETGLTEGKKCSVCGETLVAQEEIPALGHSEVTDAAKAPTCTETGLTEGSHCATCGETLVAQEEVAALGHTEVVYAEAKEATCTETGLTVGKKCSVCDAVTEAQKIIPAKGHSYQEAVTTEPTCGTDGVKTLTCTRCSATSTEAIPATNEHDYDHGTIECDKEYQWKKCAMCDATNYKAPRTFRIVFQGGAGGDDIVLPGVYFYGYNETFIVPEFVSNFFKYEYSWAVDGQKLEPGKTMHVSDLASLIKTDPTVDNWNTIYVEGGYQVSGLDPNAIQMSMQYQNNSDVQNNEIFLTLSIFIRVEPGMTHEVVQSGGTEHTTLNIDGEQVGNLGLYHYQIPLTAEQMNDKSLEIKISYTENGRPVLSKVIGVNLMAYSDALNAMLGPDVTGQASQQLIAATMAYGAAIQTMDKKDAEGNIVPGDIEILNKFNELWKTEAAAVKVLDTIATAPEYSGEADYLTDAEGDRVLDADGNPIPIAKITGANVAMSRTYALLYRYEVNLPEGVEPTDFRLILTDDEQALDRTKPWDKKTGTSYTEITQVPDTTADGTPIVYDVFAIENVPASEMAVRYATLYIEYVDENGTECHAYSRTVKYGVVTYLNGQIDKMLSTPGFVIDNASDSELKELYLWSNLRTVAMLAEQKTNN